MQMKSLGYMAIIALILSCNQPHADTTQNCGQLLIASKNNWQIPISLASVNSCWESSYIMQSFGGRGKIKTGRWPILRLMK